MDISPDKVEPESAPNLAVLMEVQLPVSIRFGETEMLLEDVVKLGIGSVIEFNSGIDQPVELIVNNRTLARGEIVTVDGLPVTLPPPPTNAPVISGPVTKIFDFIGTGSNWMTAVYGIASSDGDMFGGGIALAYKLSDFAAPVLRLDYYDGRVWMPSGSLQLQAPIIFGGKVKFTPFVFGGIATPLGGTDQDGDVVGIFGLGAALSLTKKVSLVGDVEKWTGFDAEQIRFGLLYKF